MIKNIFQKTFNIRGGEFRITMLMQLYVFIVIAVLLLVKPTINALFLSHLGAEELPNAYLLVAVTAVLSSFFYDKSLRFFSIKAIAVVTLIFFSLCFLLLAYILQNNLSNDFILYGYYLSVSIFGVLVTSQFWILANMVYNAREAKRLFGLIGSGAIIGGIVGGYLTTLISQMFGSIYVILLAAILILFCIPIVLWVWNHRLHNTSNKAEAGHLNSKIKKDLSAVRLIFRSKHLTYLALTVGVSVIMAKLVDYQFSDFAHIKITDPDELASFFGFWFSTFNVLSLVIQLFLTNRLLAWLGVTSSLLILPLGIAIGCLLFLFFPELWVLILLKGVDGSFKQSINKASIELSIMPIPYEDKKQAKSFIDVVVDSIATGIAGFLLIFVIKGLDLHSHYITVIILFFLFVWIILIYQLKGAYFESFKSNILKAVGNHNIDALSNRKKSIHSSVIKILNTGTEHEIITLLESLGETILDVHKPYVIKLLDHPSDAVKAAAIKEIYFFRHNASANKIGKLIETNLDPEVVYEAMEYMLLHTNVNENKLFNKYLDHPNRFIADAALLCLAELAMDNKYLSKRYDLFKRLEKRILEIKDPAVKHSDEEIAEFLVTLGYARYSSFFGFIKGYLLVDNIYILKHAIKAAGLSKHKNFIGLILVYLQNDELRNDTINALQHFGNEVPKFILEQGVYDSFDVEVRTFFPMTMLSLKTKDSLKVLMRLEVSSDPFIRFETVKAMVSLHSQEMGIKINKERIVEMVQRECDFYHSRLIFIRTLVQSDLNGGKEDTALDIGKEVLINLLQSELDCSMNTVFAILSLVLNEDDMDIAFIGIKDTSESVKENTIEFLDNILSIWLKPMVMPLMEYHFLQGKTLMYLSEGQVDLDNPKKCLTTLLMDGNKNLKLAVLNVIELLDDPEVYLNTLEQLTSHKETVICTKAKKIIKAIKVSH